MSLTIHERVLSGTITTESASAPVLRNNHKLWFVENKDLDIITIGISFEGSGSSLDPKPGLGQLVVQMLQDAGAGDLSRDDFQKSLLEKDIHISMKIMADRVIVTVQVPTIHLSEGVEKLKLLLLSPIFNGELLALSQQKLMASLQHKAFDPEMMAKEAFMIHVLGPDHVYSQTIQKQIDTIAHASLDDVKTLHPKLFTTACVLMSACGKADLDTLQQDLQKLVTALPSGQLPDYTKTESLLHAGESLDVKAEIPQTVVYYAHPGVDILDPQYDILNMLLAALGKTPFESRLWEEIREKRGLSYGVSLNFITTPRQDFVMGSLSTTPVSKNEAITIVKQEFEKCAKTGITQAELDLQKQYITGAYPLMFNTSSDVVSILLTYLSRGYGHDYVKTYCERIQSVTLDQVNDAAKTFLKPDALTFVSLGSDENLV